MNAITLEMGPHTRPAQQSAPRIPLGFRLLCVLSLALPLLSGCSIRKLAVNKLGDALASGGTSFATDDDPELIRDAAPFSLKTMEALLEEAPQHTGLRQAAAGGFTQYAFAFVQQEADEKEGSDLAASETLRNRARRLYLRARNHALRGLEVRSPQLESRLRQGDTNALAKLGKREVPLLFWAGASWAAAISISKDQPELIGELPIAERLLDRALTLDPDWNRGALHGLFISLEMSRSGRNPKAAESAKMHFDKAIALSQGRTASPYLNYAESVSIPQGNRKEFEELIAKALAIQPDAHPESRLENLLLQRRARWLQEKVDELFVDRPSKP